MALAMIGRLTPNSTRMPGSNFSATLLEWQASYQDCVNGNIGYIDGTVVNYWHGRREDRVYDTKWQILVKHEFDPKVDLQKTTDGLLELTSRNPGLRDDIRQYFRSRNEDGVEL
jgi:hypothetical protein